MTFQKFKYVIKFRSALYNLSLSANTKLYSDEDLVYVKNNNYTPTRRVVGILEYPCPSIPKPCVCAQSFVFCWILFIFGILVGYDLSMCILYRFHGWFIFARVIALFMFVCPYVRPHILCTQLVICLLSHFIHIWYLGWP